MDWNEKLQAIIDYVETHLQRTQEPIVMEEITKIAGCSYPFFPESIFLYEWNQFCGIYKIQKINFSGV